MNALLDFLEAQASKHPHAIGVGVTLLSIGVVSKTSVCCRSRVLGRVGGFLL